MWPELFSSTYSVTQTWHFGGPTKRTIGPSKALNSGHRLVLAVQWSESKA